MAKRPLLIIIVISVILVSIIGINGCEKPPPRPFPPPPSEKLPQEAEPKSSPSLDLAKTTYETYLTYEKFQQFEKIWPMLHPDIQDIHGDVDEFVKGMESRQYFLKDWEINLPQLIPQWTCKSTEESIGTDKTYSNVAEIPVTFVLTTIIGEIERSQMIHAVAIDNEWKFFVGKSKPVPPPPLPPPPPPPPLAPTPAPIPTPPASTPTPTLTPTPSPGYSRSNPVGIGNGLITKVDRTGGAAGKYTDIFGEYEVRLTLLETIRGDRAWQLIHDTSMFADPPESGFEYILAKVKFEYLTGQTPDTTFEVSPVWFKVVSMNGKEYDRPIGLIAPDPSIRVDLYPGASHEGWIACSVTVDDTKPLMTIGRESDGTGGIWFKLY